MSSFANAGRGVERIDKIGPRNYDSAPGVGFCLPPHFAQGGNTKKDDSRILT